MERLTGAVLIAAAGIFCLVAILSRGTLESMGGIMAFVLAVMGARYATFQRT